jgi:hypothetical protein
MGATPSSRASVRWLAAVAAVALLWLVAFENGDRVPVLTYVNLGIHEFAHLLTYSGSDLVTALAGSVGQVAVPAALAIYFFLRGDWVGAGLCLAWGATSALEVATYVADARVRELELLGGGTHDWALILGPDGYDALGRARPLAETIRDWAGVAIAIGFVLCLVSPLRQSRPAVERAPDTAATS